MKLIVDARQNMVDSQLRPNRVTNPNILSVMSDLPREYFVPTAKKDSAYIDEDIEVSSGRYLMEPLGTLMTVLVLSMGMLQVMRKLIFKLLQLPMIQILGLQLLLTSPLL